MVIAALLCFAALLAAWLLAPDAERPPTAQRPAHHVASGPVAAVDTLAAP
jgi:hypothetical protein